MGASIATHVPDFPPAPVLSEQTYAKPSPVTPTTILDICNRPPHKAVTATDTVS